MLGAFFQFAWFCLASYLNILTALDIIRPSVFLEASPVGPVIRMAVYCLTLCMAISVAPGWTASVIPCCGWKAALAKRCFCFGSKRLTPILMTLMLKPMDSRARQYEIALDENNVSWGWLIVLTVALAVLNTAFFILNTSVWLLMCCPRKRGEVDDKGKKADDKGKKKKN